MVAWNPLVSICIPTYNRADTFLRSALDSACRQTYGNLEILVSDNASSDGTAQLVRGVRDPRVVYQRHETNLGSVGNINFCIENSSGLYTLLLMDDDSIDSDFIACCVDAARTNPQAGLIRTGARVVDDSGQVIYSTPNLVGGLDFTQFVIAWTEGKTLPFMCSTLFRTAPLREIGLNSPHHHWDDVMGELEIASKHGRIDIPEIKATYRIHAGALTYREGVREWCEDSRELIALVCRLSPADASVLRRRLELYLSMLNYRIAARLKEPVLIRLREAALVYRTFRVLPQAEFLRDVVADTTLYSILRSAKSRLRRVRD